MANISPYGVCYDLENSPYTAEYRGFVFHFSTQRARERFLEEAKKRELWLTDSLSRRFHFAVDASIIALFQLYNQIEKRGCYVKVSENACMGADGSRVYRSLDELQIKAVLNYGG